MNQKIKSLAIELSKEMVLNIHPTMIDETLIEFQEMVFCQLDKRLGVPYSELSRAEVMYQMTQREGRYNVGILS